jgi:hypothetical protein
MSAHYTRVAPLQFATFPNNHARRENYFKLKIYSGDQDGGRLKALPD